MATAQDPAEHALVMKALTSGLSNCVEWINENAIRRINTNADLLETVTAEIARQLLLRYVRSGGSVEQVPETRPEYAHRTYYYKAIVPHMAFPHGLFVELELEQNPDPDVPIAFLLNDHPQRI